MFTRRPTPPPDITSKKWLKGELAAARAGIPDAAQAAQAATDQLNAHLARMELYAGALASSRAALAALRQPGEVRTITDEDGRQWIEGGEAFDRAQETAAARKKAADAAGLVEAELRVVLSEAAARLGDLRMRERGALDRLAQLDTAPGPAPDPYAVPDYVGPRGLWKDGAG